MNEQTAWRNFERTGNVIDYLQYKALVGERLRQEEGYAAEHRGTDPQRTEYR